MSYGCFFLENLIIRLLAMLMPLQRLVTSNLHHLDVVSAKKGVKSMWT